MVAVFGGAFGRQTHLAVDKAADKVAESGCGLGGRRSGGRGAEYRDAQECEDCRVFYGRCFPQHGSGVHWSDRSTRVWLTLSFAPAPILGGPTARRSELMVLLSNLRTATALELASSFKSRSVTLVLASMSFFISSGGMDLSRPRKLRGLSNLACLYAIFRYLSYSSGDSVTLASSTVSPRSRSSLTFCALTRASTIASRKPGRSTAGSARPEIVRRSA